MLQISRTSVGVGNIRKSAVKDFRVRNLKTYGMFLFVKCYFCNDMIKNVMKFYFVF